MLTVEGKHYSAVEQNALRALIRGAAKPGDTPEKVASKLRISVQLAGALMGQAPQEAAKPVRQPSGDVAVAEAPKKKRGRPAGSKNKPKEAPPVAPPVVTKEPARKAPALSTFDDDTLAVIKKRVEVGDSYESLAARLDVPVSVIVKAVLG